MKSATSPTTAATPTSCRGGHATVRRAKARPAQYDKAFSEWSEVFPRAACVVTLVDPVIHRAEVIDIEPDSYRLKEAKELTAARTKQRSKKQPS